MYSLDDFIHINFLTSHKFVVDSVQPKNVKINHIAVIEHPVENFIREKELILTTAIGCYEDINLFIDFVRGIYLSKAAALVISRKDNLYYLPEEVKAYAESVHLPIVMIPWECRFGELIEEVIHKINHNLDDTYNKFKDLEKQLLLSYVNSNPLSDAAQIISDLFSMEVSITNELSKVKGYSSGFSSEPDIEKILDGFHYTVKLILNKKLYGYIFFIDIKEIETKEDLDFFIAKYAITPLSLWFEKEDTINTTILKMKNDFISRLIANISDNYDDMISDGKSLGFDFNSPYTSIVCEVMDKKKNAFQEEFFLNELSIVTIVEENSNKNTVIFTVNDNKIIIYYKNMFSKSERSIKTFISTLDEKLRRTFQTYEFYWGVSEFSLSKSNFRKLYNNASFALNICINTEHKDLNIVTYKETIIYKIISELANNEYQINLAKQTLKPIIDKSKSSDCNLLETLKFYIENNYNTSKTARDLNIHRQSLLYRLEKIEQLTDMSLMNHSDLYVLETYLRLIYKF